MEENSEFLTFYLPISSVTWIQVSGKRIVLKNIISWLFLPRKPSLVTRCPCITSLYQDNWKDHWKACKIWSSRSKLTKSKWQFTVDIKTFLLIFPSPLSTFVNFCWLLPTPGWRQIFDYDSLPLLPLIWINAF